MIETNIALARIYKKVLNWNVCALAQRPCTVNARTFNKAQKIKLKAKKNRFDDLCWQRAQKHRVFASMQTVCIWIDRAWCSDFVVDCILFVVHEMCTHSQLIWYDVIEFPIFATKTDAYTTANMHCWWLLMLSLLRHETLIYINWRCEAFLPQQKSRNLSFDFIAQIYLSRNISFF